jgi:threonylcarbamoyladenosine tRNA methylthiotransferase MtaB
MTGFPGESDADFEETRQMIEDLPFTYLHVFTYSPRPGTSAATRTNQVPVQVARERNRILRELIEEKKSVFMRSFVGRRIEAISLNERCEGPDGIFTEALTHNFLKLRFAGRHPANHWMQAHVDSVEAGSLIGRLAENFSDLAA